MSQNKSIPPKEYIFTSGIGYDYKKAVEGHDIEHLLIYFPHNNRKNLKNILDDVRSEYIEKEVSELKKIREELSHLSSSFYVKRTTLVTLKNILDNLEVDDYFHVQEKVRERFNIYGRDGSIAWVILSRICKMIHKDINELCNSNQCYIKELYNWKIIFDPYKKSKKDQVV
jgi:hypothetical protein